MPAGRAVYRDFVNIFDLSAHQLDVIRTMASIVGAIGGFIGGIGAIGAFLARYWAKKAAHNTASEDWAGGKLVRTPVAETARHGLQKAQQAVDTVRASGEATRQEVSDLAGWVKGPGRRRQPTTEIPHPSTYSGETHEP